MPNRLMMHKETINPTDKTISNIEQKSQTRVLDPCPFTATKRTGSSQWLPKNSTKPSKTRLNPVKLDKTQ